VGKDARAEACLLAGSQSGPAATFLNLDRGRPVCGRRTSRGFTKSIALRRLEKELDTSVPDEDRGFLDREIHKNGS
jgi:hypothetical protein